MNTPVTTKTLLISTIIAAILAFIIYFVFILPAEFNQDPTGLGKKLGLMVLSEPNISKPKLSNIPTIAPFAFTNDEINIAIPANKGIEYKFNLHKYGRLIYQWNTLDNSDIYFDFHGEPKGDTTGFFESYSISTANNAKGTVTVPFNGIHGWYWKNNTNDDITIKLITSGNYTVQGLKN